MRLLLCTTVHGMLMAACVLQIGSVHQDLLVVLEGTVVMMTNFLGGPLMTDDLHVTSLPNRWMPASIELSQIFAAVALVHANSYEAITIL